MCCTFICQGCAKIFQASGYLNRRMLSIFTISALPDKPNIVYIMADDLGYTDPACYGSKYYETPNIDNLASQGMRFLQGYSCGPNCQPTRAALMSGQYGPRTGIYTVGNIDRFDWQSRPLKPVENVVDLPLKKITLADSLKSNGYKTALFGRNSCAHQLSILKQTIT